MASGPPPGPPPSKEFLAESLQGDLRGTGIAFIVLNTAFYAQRLYSRYLQGTRWGSEDYLMVFAYIMAQAVCVDCILSINFGVGIHFELFMQIEPELFPSWGANSLYALPILYMMASTIPKIAILILYLRILIQPYLRWGCWITMVVLVLACILNLFTFAFQCKPVEAAWTPAIQGIYCNDILGHLTYSPITNIVTDVAMLILPLPVIFRLNAPKSVKIGLALTFLLASLGLIASCTRFAIFVIYENNWDYTWVTAQMSIWSCVESSVYFISACLLMCRPLLHKVTTWPPLVRMFQRIKPGANKEMSASSDPSYTVGGGDEGHKSSATSGEGRRGRKARRESSSLGISELATEKTHDEAEKDDETNLQMKKNKAQQQQRTGNDGSAADLSSRDASRLEAQDFPPSRNHHVDLAPAQSDGDARWTRRMHYDMRE